MTGRPGVAFQDFVAMLERVLHNAEGVEIQSPLRLRDRDTGRLREHDIVIVRTTHHGPIVTAVECRDRSRKVTVEQVEAFAKKCERTGVHHGVIVAAKGFADTARGKAKALNVSCVDLAAAERFPWINACVLVGRVCNYTGLEGEVGFCDPDGRALQPYKLIDAKGKEVGSHTFANLIDLECISDEAAPLNVPKTGTLTITDGRFCIEDANGEVFAIDHLKLRYTFMITETHVPFQLRHYRSGSINMEIAHSYAGEDGAKAEFMLISSPDGVTGVVRHHLYANPRVQVGDLPSRSLSPACEGSDKS